MYEISRLYEFSAAHRIAGHPKCSKMHGHNYTVEVVLLAHRLESGMVMDFGELDKIVKPIIGQFDHHFINPIGQRNDLEPDDQFFIPTSHSTAECIAQVLYDLIYCENHMVKEVSVWETSKSKATYRPG